MRRGINDLDAAGRRWMRLSLEEYRREVDERAAQFVEAEALSQRDDHLRAFNFGRMIQRAEHGQRGAWLRIGWLVSGLVIGTLCGRAIPSNLPHALMHRFLTQTKLLAHKTKTSTLWKVRAHPHTGV